MAQNSSICRNAGIGKHLERLWIPMVEGLELLASRSRLYSVGHRKHL